MFFIIFLSPIKCFCSYFLIIPQTPGFYPLNSLEQLCQKDIIAFPQITKCLLFLFPFPSVLYDASFQTIFNSFCVQDYFQLFLVVLRHFDIRFLEWSMCLTVTDYFLHILSIKVHTVSFISTSPGSDVFKIVQLSCRGL